MKTTEANMKSRSQTWISLLGVFHFLMLNGATEAAATETNSAVAHYNVGADKLALQGYDPVAYFKQGRAVKGSRSIATEHNGVLYWFATDTDKTLFTESPDKFLPAYGGWCATAMAKGEQVEIDPTNFKVTNGRLFLFYKAFYANAIKDWNKAEAALTARADAHWKKISGE